MAAPKNDQYPGNVQDRTVSPSDTISHDPGHARRWPELPDLFAENVAGEVADPFAGLSEGRWQQVRRAWRRRQRLAHEQRGEPWNESPF